MSKFEVQVLDSEDFVDDTMGADTLQEAVTDVARMIDRGSYTGNTFKIFELVEVPFVIERTDLVPTGREPVSATVGTTVIRTL